MELIKIKVIPPASLSGLLGGAFGLENPVDDFVKALEVSRIVDVALVANLAVPDVDETLTSDFWELLEDSGTELAALVS